jgi:hypothetical protein
VCVVCACSPGIWGTTLLFVVHAGADLYDTTHTHTHTHTALTNLNLWGVHSVCAGVQDFYLGQGGAALSFCKHVVAMNWITGRPSQCNHSANQFNRSVCVCVCAGSLGTRRSCPSTARPNPSAALCLPSTKNKSECVTICVYRTDLGSVRSPKKIF